MTINSHHKQRPRHKEIRPTGFVCLQLYIMSNATSQSSVIGHNHKHQFLKKFPPELQLSFYFSFFFLILFY